MIDRLLDLWNRCNFPLRDGLKIMSLRGMAVKKGQPIPRADITNEFDDTMFLWDEKTGYINHVNCTAGRPGWYWIQKYGSGDGAPFSRPGCYAYIRGLHKGKNKCLVQENSEFGRAAVIRDVNKNGVPEISQDAPDLFDYPLDTGIHIHACQGTPTLVGVWSSGCHVVQSDWNGADWQTVYNLTYNIYGNQNHFWYGVCESSWFFDEGRRLLYGSYGVNVLKLNDFLKTHGVADLHNPHFGQDTDVAYRRWQRMNNRPQDGVSCNAPWAVG